MAAREKGASGEKVIWCPRGMNGELGGGTMSYGRICLKCGGGVTVLPLPLGFSDWVCVLRAGDSKVTLLLPNSGCERFRARRACFEIVGVSDFRRGGCVLNYSGRERFRARRACFEIVGASYFGRGERVLPTMVYELFGTCYFGRGEAALG